MEIKNLEAIESLGHLLAYYKSDLEYIAKFKLFKNNEITAEKYLTENKGFQKFINEFKVARNIRKERVRDLMIFIKDSKLMEDNGAVDAFAEEIKSLKLTQEDKIMTVLASKIFFLNQPDKIIPMDKFNKKTLGLKGNKYNEFKIRINEFINKNSEILSAYLDNVSNYLVEIEKSVNIKMDFEKYRINRFTDKYLWAKGREL
ncbi:MAG: hypothetical protein PHP01_01195 [Phycisphaerae bacterium]|nr:hypothetical protein [Phycisphaerae bacterium]